MRIFTIIMILLFALMGGLGIGYLIQIDTGYVRISWSHFLLETNIWIAAIVLIVLYLLLNLFFKTIGKTLAAKAGFVEWRERGQNRRAQLRTNRGLLELAEGNWRKAERYLARSADQSSTPLVNYMAAAQAASEQGKFEQSDELLQEAEASVDGSVVAIGLTKAQLQMKRGQTEDGIATLKQLRTYKPHQPMVIKLLSQGLVKLQRWQELSELLPDLRKSDALDKAELDNLQRQVWAGSLQASAQQSLQENPQDSSTAQIKQIWERMPSALRKTPDMVAGYARQLVKLGAEDQAIAALERYLGPHWNESLVNLYGQIEGNTAHQLETCETWLKVRREDPALLLTLGRLAARSENLSKAREYLERSLKAEDSPETCAELGQVLAQLDTPEDANEYLLRAVSGSVHSTSNKAIAKPAQTAIESPNSQPS